MSSPTVLKAFRLDAVTMSWIMWAFTAEWRTNFIFPPGHPWETEIWTALGRRGR